MIGKNKFIFSLIGVSSLFQVSRGQSQHPNIIILTADDLGWNDISSSAATKGCGSRNHQTPNIDKLAQESMVFSNAHSQQNSAPTRAALLTGQYANRTNVYNVFGLNRYAAKNEPGIKKVDARIIPADQKQESIASGTLTFAKLLRDAGYETYIFGKVHGFLMTQTEDNGFSHNFECEKSINGIGAGGSNYFAYQTADGNWIFDKPSYSPFAKPYTKEYIQKNLLPFANGNDPMSLIGTKKHFTDAIGDVVIDQISKASTEKPFCMWVAFHAIHSAIVGRQDLYEKYRKRTTLDERHSDYKYAALTEQLDQTVGRILAALDDPNGDGDVSDSKRANTLVVFMSDNGGVGFGKHSNEPLRASKGTLYEGGIRIPMMVRFPSQIKAATVTDEPVHVIDYLPTFLDFAGIKYRNKAHPLDGESLYPLLTGKATTLHRKALYWHFPGYMDDRGIPASVISKRIGNKRYKYRYCYEYDTHELYDLTNDMGETQNLLSGIPSGANLKIGNELLADLNKWMSSVKPLPMYYVNTGQQVKLPRTIRIGN